MSGLEVVGVVASVAQLIDLGLKVALKLSSLTSSLQRVPERLSSASLTLVTFVGICKDLRTSLETNDDLSTSSESTNRIQGLFDACAKDVAALEAVLDKLDVEGFRSSWDRSWKKVVGLKREKEIVERCERLGCHKTNLMLICHDQHLQRLHQQAMTLSDINTKISLNTNTLTDLRTIVETSMNLLVRDIGTLALDTKEVEDTPHKTLPPYGVTWTQGDRIGQQPYQSWAKAGHTLVCASSNLEERLLGSSGSQEFADNNSLQNVVLPIQQAHDDLEKLFTHLHSIRRAFQRVCESKCSNGFTKALASKPSVLYEHAGFLTDLYRKDSSGGYLSCRQALDSCTCGKRARRRKQLILGPFWVCQEQAQAHSRSCPRSQEFTWIQSARMGFSVRCLSLAIEFSFAATRGAGGHSIGPTISVTRIVDRKLSPAFKLFDSLHQDYAEFCGNDASHIQHPDSPCGYHHYRVDSLKYSYAHLYWDMPGLSRRLKLLQKEMCFLFESGRASPADTDPDGRTLLHEIVILASLISFPSVDVSAATQSLISFLVRCHAVLDARCRRLIHPILQQDPARQRLANVDAMDIAICGIAGLEDHYEEEWVSQTRIRTDAMLSSHGCEFTDPKVSADMAEHVDRVMPVVTIGVLQCVEGSSQAIGYGPLSQAVVRRYLPELKTLLEKGYDPNEVPSNVPGADIWRHSPLTLALHWYEGFEALILAGADVIETATFAIDGRYKDAIRLLIRHDLPLSTKYLDDCIMFEALLACCLDDAMLQQVITLAADQRRRLRELASNVLPANQICDLQIGGGSHQALPDVICVDVQRAIEDRGMHVPISINVFEKKTPTIYHSRLLTDTAVFQRLFDAGFTDIDHANCELGRCPTPFMRHCLKGNFGAALWFFNHGARTRVESGGYVWLAQSMMALTCLDEGNRQNGTHILRTVSQINDPLPTDDCSCWCAMNGCSPINMLQKAMSRGPAWCKTWDEKVEVIRIWIAATNMTPEKQFQAWTQFYRSEIFTRLGMAHTCCQVDRSVGVKIVDLDDQEELRAEDKAAGLFDELEERTSKYLEETASMMTRQPSDLTSNRITKEVFAIWRRVNKELPENVTRQERMADPTITCQQQHECQVEYLSQSDLEDVSGRDDDDDDNDDDVDTRAPQPKIASPARQQMVVMVIEDEREPAFITGIRRSASTLVIAPRDLMERTRPSRSDLGPPP